MGNSVMACVVGLIMADLVGTALGEPEVAVGPSRDRYGSGAGSGDGELIDGYGQQAARLQALDQRAPAPPA